MKYAVFVPCDGFIDIYLDLSGGWTTTLSSVVLFETREAAQEAVNTVSFADGQAYRIAAVVPPRTDHARVRERMEAVSEPGKGDVFLEEVPDEDLFWSLEDTW